MILDSSAVVSVVRREQGCGPLIEAIDAATQIAIGAPTLLETTIVLLARLDVVGRLILSRFLEEYEVVEVPFDARHRSVASEAFIRFGKGRHPAALNFGDCMTYATARVAERPLLYTGEDFAKTDISTVL